MKLTLVESFAREGDVRSFVFKPEKELAWSAGQYLHYTLPHPEADDRGVERWFTISSAPSEKNIMITTRISGERSSSFKTALVALKPGDTIEADEPEGDFVITDPSRNMIFVAGGIGITPYRSMLVESAAQGQKLHVRLLYPNRTNDIPFREELDRLAQENHDLQIEYIVQPDRLDNQKLEQIIHETDNPIVYISGPEPMVEALTEEVGKMGVSGDNIRSDYFPGYEAD
jgi:ferredoxin-NADP reductase